MDELQEQELQPWQVVSHDLAKSIVKFRELREASRGNDSAVYEYSKAIAVLEEYIRDLHGFPNLDYLRKWMTSEGYSV